MPQAAQVEVGRTDDAVAGRTRPAQDGFATVIDLIDALARHGDRAAILAMRRGGIDQRSYGVLAEEVRRLAAGLITAGLRRGEAVALFADNRPEWIIACLAIIRAGGVVTPLDVQLESVVRDRILADSEARFVFTTEDKAADLGTGRQLWLLDGDDRDSRSWRQLLADKTDRLPSVDSGDGAALFYTSGTTGPPKGVPLTHGNLVFQLNELVRARFVTDADRLLVPLPLHHVYPFVFGILAPFSLGIPLVLPRALTGPQVAEAVGAGGATMIIGVPRLYTAMYDGIRRRFAAKGRLAGGAFDRAVGFSTWLRRRFRISIGRALFKPLHKRIGPNLRILVSGGAALDPDLAWKLEGLGWDVASGYGLTETSPMLTWNLPGKGKIETAGQPIAGVDIRIDPAARPGADDDAGPREHRADAVGEILARGPNVFAGYRNLPDKTGKVLSDGWFRTGDLGFLDDDGFLHIVGRVSTMIVTEGGKNVQPDDVEEAYVRSPVIREIGVLERNRRLAALIVPDIRASGEDVPAAVREAIRDRSRQLPSYQRISDFQITHEPLPRTRLGKPRRHLLAERYEQAEKGEEPDAGAAAGPLPVEKMPSEDRALLEEPSARRIWDWLADRYGDRPLTLDSSLQLDLGVDSMDWLNLTLEIGQRVGVELGEDAIGRVETVRDLLGEVIAASAAGEATSWQDLLEDPERVLSDRQQRWLSQPGPIARAFGSLLYGLNRGAMRGLFRLRTTGQETLPEHPPYVIAVTHASYLDPFAVAAALSYGRLRHIYWGGWTGAAFANPLARSVSRVAQVVPIDPERGIFSSMAFAAAVLKRGNSLILFPEGERSPSGKLQAFKPGIGMLLDRYPVPVVPAVIRGAHEALPRGRAWPRLHRITVTFGEPLDPGELARRGEGAEAKDRIVDALHRRVAAMVPANDR